MISFMHSARFLLRASAAVLLTCCSVFLYAKSAKSPDLHIYFIDTEGGQATLIVTPDHKSLLVDTGFPGFDGRDANRIVATTKEAGLDHLDYVLITNYHLDHVGGVYDLAKRLRIGTFLDHGPNREDDAHSKSDYAAYEKLWAGHGHRVLKPGDRVSLGGASLTVVASAGEAIKSPLPGAGQQNAAC